ncbi:biogenesis of lysosome-related organelles complex 1 subunit 3-like [Centruroides sculpturatus]|uniref:biogenesis of lysosome-related organelles complex 1 subunit 3-like n=1 Tax=Centruroides sculpturatus TaxID=218467 RepID=UPI000C6E9B08|nr:biogenesis of lysosome-related organelles complex 1 subunit 3-like [Centruroides sculpturatus]
MVERNELIKCSHQLEMAKAKGNAQVIPGEAYESDEDVEVSHFMSPPDMRKTPLFLQGIVVSGEASESDEEICSGPTSASYATGEQNFDLRCSSSESVEKMDIPKFEERLRYNTLLHRKLREKNQSLHKNLIEMACQPYQSAAKEIGSISQQLIKSQILVQEVSSTLRRLTNDLFQLEDKVQTIRSCTLLPDINISPPVSPDI